MTSGSPSDPVVLGVPFGPSNLGASEFGHLAAAPNLVLLNFDDSGHNLENHAYLKAFARRGPDHPVDLLLALGSGGDRRPRSAVVQRSQFVVQIPVEVAPRRLFRSWVSGLPRFGG